MTLRRAIFYSNINQLFYKQIVICVEKLHSGLNNVKLPFVILIVFGLFIVALMECN